MKSFILAAMLLTGLQLFGQSGKIAGNVVAIQENDALPLPAVTITIVELSQSISSNEEGRFKFSGIPAGTYTLIYEHPQMGSDTLSELEVETGAVAIIRLELPAKEARKEN